MRRVLALCSAAVVMLGLVLPTTSAGASSLVVASSPAAVALAAQAAVPTVTSVTGAARGSGPSSGGTVTIRGTGFAAGATVTFGTAAGSGIRVKSSTTLTAVAPARFPSAVDVRVTTAAGTSAATQASRYTYLPLPVRNLGYTTALPTSISLAWQNPVGSPGFSAIVVRRAVGAVAPASATTGTPIASLPNSVSALTDTGLAPNTTYSYAVFAKAGVHAAAATLTVHTPAAGSVRAVTLPLPSGGLQDLGDASIECPGTGWCLSLGTYQDRTSVRVAARILSDGVWTATSFGPSVPTSSEYGFLNVETFACRDRGSCLALVSAEEYDGEETTSETDVWALAATTWTRITTPRPTDTAPGGYARLFELTCPTTATCLGLGSFEGKDRTEHAFLATRTGSTWTTRVLPDRSVDGNRVWPWDLTCRTVTSCVASGLAFDEDEGGWWAWASADDAPLRSRTLARAAIARKAGPEIADRWTGTDQESGASAAHGAGGAAARGAVAATPAARSGVGTGAGGTTASAADEPLPFPEPTAVLFRLDGASWTAAPVPLPGGASDSFGGLPRLACAATYCLALTTYTDAADRVRSLSLTSGSAGSWTSREPIPLIASRSDMYAVPSDVDCVDDTCTLTGTRGSWVTSTAIAATTIGGIWTRTAIATTSPDSWLGAIGCSSTTSCVVVGEQYTFDEDSTSSQPLLASLRNRAGVAVTAPVTSAAARSGAESFLATITCQPGGACLGTGYSYGRSGDSASYTVVIDPGSGR